MTVPGHVDWGDPRPAEWTGPRETLSARLPVAMVRAVRDQARAEGVTVSILLHRLLDAAMNHRHIPGGAGRVDLVSTLFD